MDQTAAVRQTQLRDEQSVGAESGIDRVDSRETLDEQRGADEQKTIESATSQAMSIL
jgi:hypothetical protein